MESEDTNGILDYPVSPIQPVGIYGWRKRCIYAFVLILMVVVIINLALTVWILRVLDFSVDGMGRLKISPNGFELKGEAEFLKPIYASEVVARENNPLYIQSEKAVEIMSVTGDGESSSSLKVDSDSITASCDVFKVIGPDGITRLMVKDNKITLDTADFTYKGHVIFNVSVETPGVRSPPFTPLELVSESSSVIIKGHNVKVAAESDINIKSFDRGVIRLAAKNINLNSPKIMISSLPTTATSPAFTYSRTSLVKPKVFQLCICKNGRVYIDNAEGRCNYDSTICES